MGVYKFAQVWIDPFSKRVYARALAKLTSANTVDIFRSIIETEKGGHYPDRVLTDRGDWLYVLKVKENVYILGSEFLGKFSEFLHTKGIRHVFTTEAAKNKAFWGNERLGPHVLHSNRRIRPRRMQSWARLKMFTQKPKQRSHTNEWRVVRTRLIILLWRWFYGGS